MTRLTLALWILSFGLGYYVGWAVKLAKQPPDDPDGHAETPSPTRRG